MTWIAQGVPGPGPFTSWQVALVEDGETVKVHPIPFPYEREADRAAARLNVRDAKAAEPPAPPLMVSADVVIAALDAIKAGLEEHSTIASVRISNAKLRVRRLMAEITEQAR